MTKRSRHKTALTAGVLAVVIAVGAFLAAGTANAQKSALPRNATLYTSGTAWGPFSQFNPLRTSGNATGTLGLLYETLFRYDPLKDKYIPWLATDGKWVGRTYVLHLRPGVKWSDGKPLTGADVKFTFETGKLAGSELSTMWKTGLSNILVKGNTVSFVFTGKPNYLDWDTNIYSYAIVPAASLEELQRDRDHDRQHRQDMVGTGPFTYGAGKGTSGTLQWNRRSDWWATKALGMKMPMQYLVDIHNTQNTASLQNFLKDNIDLSNNFFPGVDKVVGGKVQTYYPKAPYMLSANTAWLVPNTTHAAVERCGVPAGARDVDQRRPDRQGRLRQHRREGQPDRPAADLEQVDRPGPGARSWASRTASPSAKSLLAPAGYKDTNGDGYVENKDGSNINLRLIVPNGWSDWMTAIQIIAASAKDAGIKITPAYPDYNGLVDERNSGKFDLVINNDKQLGNTPYHLLRLPLPPPDRRHADVRELLALHAGGAEAVGADARAQQGQPGERGGGEGDPLQIQKYILRGSACDPALVQRDVVAVQHDVLDELPDLHRDGAAEHPDHVERVPQHDGHRRARQAEAQQVRTPRTRLRVPPHSLRGGRRCRESRPAR